MPEESFTFSTPISPDSTEDPELGALLRLRQEHLRADQYGQAAFSLLQEVLGIIQQHIQHLPPEAVEQIRETISKAKTNL